MVSAQEIVQADVIVVRKDKKRWEDVGAQVNWHHNKLRERSHNSRFADDVLSFGDESDLPKFMSCDLMDMIWTLVV